MILTELNLQPIFGRIIHGIAIVLLFIVQLVSIPDAGAQVTVTLQLPPPGDFSPDDFIHLISFQNSTGASKIVYLNATVEESSTGLIFAGKSAEFELMPGMSTPHYTTYEPVKVDFIDPKYEQFVLQTNSLPSGSYIICVRVLDAFNGEELSIACLPHEILQPSAPVLVYPADNAGITEPNPVFIWLPPSPAPMAEMTYMLRIVELLEGQNPYEAVRSNPPYYAEGNISGSILLYGLNAPAFAIGRSYAWQIQALSSEGLPIGENEGFSEISVFTIGEEPMREILPISPVSACVGHVTESVTTENVMFQFMASGQFTGFQVIASSNPCGVFPPPGTPVPPPSPPTTPPGTPPTTPGKPPVSGGKPPGLTPTQPSDTVKAPVGGNPPVTTGGGTVVTTGGTGTDTSGTGNAPADQPPGSEVDWPDEGESDLPPLPPGWVWGPTGPRWTGEVPPPPPDLPPGWEWGPLRPVWVGLGTEPPPRRVIAVSSVVPAIPDPTNTYTATPYSVNMQLSEFLKPGQAFIYQVCGFFTLPSGKPSAYLSQTQCLRYSYSANADVEAQPLACDPCLVELKPDTAPAMDGGLEPPVESFELGRDEFVVLKAIGLDYDQIWWQCNPKPNCPESSSKDMRVTSSRVRFNWKIVSGEGDFVELGCSGSKRETGGDRVIFMPPDVAPDSTKVTQVKLSIIDDNPSQPLDKTVNRMVKITIERKRDKPNYYAYKIESDSFNLPSPTQISGSMGTCKTAGPSWTQDEDLVTPVVKLPEGQDAGKLVYKELIRLYANDVRDPDNVKVWCISERCPTNDKKRTYEDDVLFEWTIVKGGGQFIKGNKGRFVVYEAPDYASDVEIEVRVSNTSGLKIADKKPGPGKITLKVYEPGVKIERTDLTWLPGASNNVLKKSYLVYKDNNEWKTGLQHQCRIHYVELMSVSAEPGVCMNWPPAVNADTCIDMAFKESTQWDGFDTVYCTRWNNADTTWFRHANSLIPVKEFTVQVRCYDFGAWAKIRSMANSDKSPSGNYKSVPWKASEQYHAGQGRNAKTEYDDNRVCIPRDADENHIADNGWLPENRRIAGVEGVSDPQKGIADDDNVPQSDFKGDGISNFEEYRGFMVKGAHQRLDIARKNLFLWNRDNIGLGGFPNSGVISMQVLVNEMDTGRVINYNRKTDSLGFDQKGLRLVSWPWTINDRVGQAEAIGLDSCTWVFINASILNNTEIKNYAIAHELSHGIGVWHHGEGYIWGYHFRDEKVKIGNTWITNTVADTLFYPIACAGGLTSGDVECWMRYMYTTAYCIGSGTASDYDCTNNMEYVDISDWTLVAESNNRIGKFITDNTSGTGVNAMNKCGKKAGTGRGKCRSQIKITCKP